jgi:hypothetical protein
VCVHTCSVGLTCEAQGFLQEGRGKESGLWGFPSEVLYMGCFREAGISIHWSQRRNEAGM